MALTFSNHVAPASSTGTSTTQTLTSVALTGARLHFLIVTADRGSNATLGDPSVTQTGATWTLVASRGFANSSRRKVAVFRCQPSNNVTAANIVITWPQTTTARLATVDISNNQVFNDASNNGAGCIVRSGTNGITSGTASTLTVTLGATPAAGNVTYGAGGTQISAAVTFTPGTGFTELTDEDGAANNIAQATEYWNFGTGNATATVNMTRSGANTWGLVGLEVKAISPLPSTVFAVANPTVTNVEAVATAHYGTTVSGFVDLIDPDGPGRTPDQFAQAWWGKNFADSYNEVLLTERFLQLCRMSARHQVNGSDSTLYFKWLGGDVLDTFVIQIVGDDTGRRYWIGSDYPVDGEDAVDLATNKYKNIGTLPLRNHILTEFKNGEVDVFGNTTVADSLGAGFRTQAGPNITTWVTPNQTSYPGEIYWPLCALANLDSGVTYYIGAWLTDPAGGGVLNHALLDSHILKFNVFGTVDSVAVFDHGVGSSVGYICDFLEESTYTYVYFREFVPVYGPGTPNHYENLSTDTTYHKVARIDTSGALTVMDTQHTGSTFTNYQWWDGSGWSSNSANAARMKTTGAVDIAGDAAVARLGANDYIMAAQRYWETSRRVYKASTAQGPWTLIATLPTPLYAQAIFTDVFRTCIHMKIHTDLPAPAGHVMSMSATMAFGSGTNVLNGRHIHEQDIPYFLALPVNAPWEGTGAVANVSATSGSWSGTGTATWTGSGAAVDVLGASATWSAPPPWPGTDGLVSVVATPGVFVNTWPSNPATVNVSATSGTWTPSAATWTGDDGFAEVAAASGTWTGTASTWTGGTGATANVSAVSGTWSVPGSQTWTGGTDATLALTASSGVWIGIWTGSAAAITVTATSNPFSAGAVSPTYAGLRYAANHTTSRATVDRIPVRSSVDHTPRRTTTEFTP